MYNQNNYLDLVVDLIVGDSYTNLPSGFQNSMIDEEMLHDFALTLRDQYPNAVERSIWAPINLQKSIDWILDESDPIFKHTVFGNHSFSQSDRQKILHRCAKIVCDKLQRYIGSRPRVCYKVMPNGRVGYRLE